VRQGFPGIVQSPLVEQPGDHFFDVTNKRLTRLDDESDTRTVRWFANTDQATMQPLRIDLSIVETTPVADEQQLVTIDQCRVDNDY